jgi:single-strand DNA-binding protein
VKRSQKEMNRVILSGEIGSDITLKKTATGQSLCNFSIEVKEKGKDGQERKYFFDCTAWGENAEHINQYGFRGQHIAVDGKLQKSSYTNKENQKVYKTSVYVMDVELSVNNATMPQTQAYQQQASQQSYQPQTVPFTNQVNYQSYPEHYDNDEGMPF